MIRYILKAWGSVGIEVGSSLQQKGFRLLPGRQCNGEKSGGSSKALFPPKFMTLNKSECAGLLFLSCSTRGKRMRT